MPLGDRLRELLLLSALFVPSLAVGDPDEPIAIGVLSPRTGTSAPIGIAHEQSIALAFESLDGSLPIGGSAGLVPLQPVFLDDEGSDDPTHVRSLVQQLEDARVVAVLGPVNSRVTKRLLEELPATIPVISSLSTASELTGSARKSNFFRLVFDDSRRMQQYANYLRERERELGTQEYLFLYEDDAYGRGLKEALGAHVTAARVESWCAIVSAGCAEDGRDGLLPPSIHDSLEEGTGFADAFLESLGAQTVDNVVLLGNGQVSPRIARGLQTTMARNGRILRFFFVGSSREIFKKAPLGSITIGDPVLDPDVLAPDTPFRSKWTTLLSQFEARGQHREDFVVGAFDAARLVHEGLRQILAAAHVRPALDQMRERLLEGLNSGQVAVESVEPWRRIRFTQGSLEQPPEAPIYSIDRTRKRLNGRPDYEWIQISKPSPVNFLEGPLVVRLTGRTRQPVVLKLYRDGRLIDERSVPLEGDGRSAAFHWLRPGSYRLETNPVRQSEEMEVGWPRNYLLAASSAFVGALLVLRQQLPPRGAWSGFRRVLSGICAGVILALASFSRDQLSGYLPVPSFSETPSTNAVAVGLVGGWLGLGFVIDLLGRGVKALIGVWPRRN
jgi:hypothetical protein